MNGYKKMTKKSTPPGDDYTIRCPRLGHQISFTYCRSENMGYPCFKTLDCWFQHFPVEEYLRKELTPDEWEKAFAGRPVDIPSHLVNLGMFYFRSERYDQAIQAWRKAGELKGDDPQLHYNIALAYFKKGQYTEATQELTASLRLQPNNHSANLLLQRIMDQEGKDSLLE